MSEALEGVTTPREGLSLRRLDVIIIEWPELRTSGTINALVMHFGDES